MSSTPPPPRASTARRPTRPARRRRTVGALALAGLALSGCVHLGRARPVPIRFQFSSEGSDYLPVGRFRGSAVPGEGALLVRVDTAHVLAPAPTPDVTGRVATGLRLTALVATDSGGRWVARGESLPIAVASTLSLGEAHTLTGLRFVVPLPAGLALRDAWLVFRFDGAPAHADPARFTVRTFACSPVNLAGPSERSSGRAALLAEDYEQAC